MTPEEDFLGPNAPSCQDFQSLRPPSQENFQRAIRPRSVDFFWNNPLFDTGFPYKYCISRRVCLPVKMASKTVIRSVLGIWHFFTLFNFPGLVYKVELLIPCSTHAFLVSSSIIIQLKHLKLLLIDKSNESIIYLMKIHCMLY